MTNGPNEGDSSLGHQAPKNETPTLFESGAFA
jgi:hypothetical protein